MRLLVGISVLLLPLTALAGQNSKWVLEKSELTYKVSHTLHSSEGTSRQTRGKGVCDESGCKFLAASPVNAFESGDTNRDLHMIETTRGAQFPMVTVNVAMPAVPEGTDFAADLDIQFAGEKAQYPQVKFQIVDRSGESVHFKGVIPMKVTDFKIPAPSLLGISIKNDVPITVDMTWKKI